MDVSFGMVERAQSALSRYLTPTPLIESAGLSAWLKLETQNPTGSFKARPAFFGTLEHLDEARKRGVVTASSGNFGLAVAHASRILGVKAKVVMMRKASAHKRMMILEQGAEVVSCPDDPAAREAAVQSIVSDEKALRLHQYDTPETIAADGTIALEIDRQLLEAGVGRSETVTVVAPVSGGGLLSGTSLAMKHLRPSARVIGVMPAANLWNHAAEHMPREATIADALVPAAPGERTWPIVKRLADGLLEVDNGEIISALKFLVNGQKLIVEPGAAAGVAAFMAGKIKPAGGPVVFILSGGNVEPERLAELIK